MRGDVERVERLLVERAGGLEPIAPLCAAHCLDHVVIVVRRPRGRDVIVLHREPSAQRGGALVGGADAELGAVLDDRPAALRVDRAIVRQSLPERVIARIGRRQRGDPRRQPVLLHGIAEARPGIEGRRPQAPVVQIVRRRKPPSVQRLRIVHHRLHQRGLIALGRGGACRQAIGLGVRQHRPELVLLRVAQRRRDMRGGRRGRFRRCGRLRIERGREKRGRRGGLCLRPGRGCRHQNRREQGWQDGAACHRGHGIQILPLGRNVPRSHSRKRKPNADAM